MACSKHDRWVSRSTTETSAPSTRPPAAEYGCSTQIVARERGMLWLWREPGTPSSTCDGGARGKEWAQSASGVATAGTEAKSEGSGEGKERSATAGLEASIERRSEGKERSGGARSQK